MRSARGRVLAGAAALIGAGLVGGGASAAPAAEPPQPQQCVRTQPILIPAASDPLTKLRAAEVRRRATGAGVVVAVVDSGVDRRNVHLGKAVLPGRSFVPGDTSPGWTDAYGHGTAIAGIIAARPVPKSGVVGLAPGVRILPVRVFVGPGTDVPPADRPRVDRIAEGIRWAANNGADIINVSMSSPTSDPALEQSVKLARSKGALVVASVGNRTDQGAQTEAGSRPAPDGQPRYPAALQGVLGATAADLGGAEFDAVTGPHVDVAAPGSLVLTTFFEAGDCLLAKDKTSTSFATGYVSAAAALLREAFPKADADVLAYRLQATATGALTGARTNVAGWGLIRPLDALSLTVTDRASALPPLGRQAAAVPTVAQPAAITIAASVNPREDAQDATVWWVAMGAAGLALVLLLGRLTAGSSRRT